MNDERANLPSASSINRLAACPGSWAAERSLPELPQEQVTDDGTLIHKALETGDGDDLDVSQAEIMNRLSAMEATELANWRVRVENGEI